MIYSFSCSRAPYNNYEGNLQKQGLAEAHEYKIDYDSIFEAYNECFMKFREEDEDTVLIFCHDDIELWDDPKLFKENLLLTLDKKNTGFVGAAGTTYLPLDSVWWDIRRREKGLHSGFVFQGTGREKYTPNYFGPCGEVVVLDGLFLAAKVGTLNKIFPDGIKKPESFPGDWDFYDLFMTVESHRKGFINRTFPGILLHKSDGSLVGRDSWHKNRAAFQELYSKEFPFTL